MVATCIGSGMEQLTSKTGGSAWALGGPSAVRYRQVSDRKQILIPLYIATFKSPDSLLAPDCFCTRMCWRLGSTKKSWFDSPHATVIEGAFSEFWSMSALKHVSLQCLCLWAVNVSRSRGSEGLWGSAACEPQLCEGLLLRMMKDRQSLFRPIVLGPGQLVGP